MNWDYIDKYEYILFRSRSIFHIYISKLVLIKYPLFFFQIPNSNILANTSNNLDQPIVPDTAFGHQAKTQCILGSDSNSHDFGNNELESRIYEEVHMNEGKNPCFVFVFYAKHPEDFLLNK